MKKTITIIAFGLLSISFSAQTPSYVPTNGLKGWWPFSGNANDASGNMNNGTVNGATLTTDRFGSANSAYSFNGSTNYINIANSAIAAFGLQSFSSSVWFKSTIGGTLVRYDNCVTGSGWGVANSSTDLVGLEFSASRVPNNVIEPNAHNDNSWHLAVFVRNIVLMKDLIYVDGILKAQTSFSTINDLQNTGSVLRFGSCSGFLYFSGFLDDIGIWNRALTQQEITNLYNAVNCSNNLTITPAINPIQIGNIATFNAITSDPNPSYMWQSDFGQGFQTLNNYLDYSGVNTNALSIANVQLSEHNQPIRVISTSGNCIDTSNVAIISIADTCINTINDTITTYISVTDTLIINATITGLTPPNNNNTIKVFPNPANDHITINYGNYAAIIGYTLKITNALGQIVFTTPINQQTSYVDLSTWSGNGIYFLQIFDLQNNIIENRKIVLQ
jgi:hypothetical protein